MAGARVRANDNRLTGVRIDERDDLRDGDERLALDLEDDRVVVLDRDARERSTGAIERDLDRVRVAGVGPDRRGRNKRDQADGQQCATGCSSRHLQEVGFTYTVSL
jgi:hypothetical protein